MAGQGGQGTGGVRMGAGGMVERQPALVELMLHPRGRGGGLDTDGRVGIGEAGLQRGREGGAEMAGDQGDHRLLLLRRAHPHHVGEGFSGDQMGVLAT
ncbi:hypothetical protein TSO5_20810 [Azospirillum sp. TSO5]|nr:hypothetical protein TSO5_20810 [Azospirillum sp. TSO5]